MFFVDDDGDGSVDEDLANLPRSNRDNEFYRVNYNASFITNILLCFLSTAMSDYF